RPYKWAGVVTMYNGRVITNDMVRASNHYLELAIERFAKDWEFPFMLGCNYLHELKTNDPNQRAAWRRMGGEYVRRAAVLGGGPSWLPLLAATIFTREGETDLAIRHLEEVYASSEDPRVREQIKFRLMAFKRQTDAERIDERRARLERDWRAWAPYAPLDLFVLLGDPPRDVDLRTLLAAPLLGPPAAALPQPRSAGVQSTVDFLH